MIQTRGIGSGSKYANLCAMLPIKLQISFFFQNENFRQEFKDIAEKIRSSLAKILFLLNWRNQNLAPDATTSVAVDAEELNPLQGKQN